VTRSGPPRRYPRLARINEVVRETVAEELERLSDPRIGLVTVTGVDVSADLRHATIYYSALEPGNSLRPQDPEVARERSEETRQALQSATHHLQREVGRQVRMKYTPEMTFREDPAIERGQRVEEIIRGLHEAERLPGDRRRRSAGPEVGT